jgi:hypothetical protein
LTFPASTATCGTFSSSASASGATLKCAPAMARWTLLRRRLKCSAVGSWPGRWLPRNARMGA